MKKRLGIGFIGSGFITRFHIRSFLAVRDADILGVWSPNPSRAQEAATLANEIGVGDATAFGSIEELVNAPGIEALSNQRLFADERSSGAEEQLSRADRISLVLPKNTAAPTCRGSGKDRCKAAECSTI